MSMLRNGPNVGESLEALVKLIKRTTRFGLPQTMTAEGLELDDWNQLMENLSCFAQTYSDNGD